MRGSFRFGNDRRDTQYIWWWEACKLRDLRKNQKNLWYALYQRKDPIFDENGDETGNYTKVYSSPVSFCASISSGKGKAQKEVFGVDVDFTRTISTTDLELPVTETSLVWYETEPTILNDGSVDPDSADYEVAARPARDLNQLMIALKARAKNA